MALARTTITVYPGGSDEADPRLEGAPASVVYRMTKTGLQGIIRVPPTVADAVEIGDLIVDSRTGYRYLVRSAIVPHLPGMWWKILGLQAGSATATESVIAATILGYTAEELEADPYDGVEPTLVKASGVQLTLKDPTRSRAGTRRAGGEQEKTVFGFRGPVADISYLDWVRDEETDVVYQVDWVERSGAAVVGELSIVRGGV